MTGPKVPIYPLSGGQAEAQTSVLGHPGRSFLKNAGSNQPKDPKAPFRNEGALNVTGALVRRQTGPVLPALIADAGDEAGRRFVEFFTANIRERQHASRLRPGRGSVPPLVRGATGSRSRPSSPIAVAAYVEELKGRLRHAVGQAAPGRHPDALRLAGDRPGHRR